MKDEPKTIKDVIEAILLSPDEPGQEQDKNNQPASPGKKNVPPKKQKAPWDQERPV